MVACDGGARASALQGAGIVRRIEDEEVGWLPVIGRSLVFLFLHYAEMRDKTLLEQADFLSKLGLPRDEAASLLVRVQCTTSSANFTTYGEMLTLRYERTAA